MGTDSEVGGWSRSRCWARLAEAPFSALLFAAGLLAYALSGYTPRPSFHSMRRLYGPTRGLFNRAALGIARRLRPYKTPASVSGFLGTVEREEIVRLVNQIDQQGYAIVERNVPDALCDALHAFASETPCLPLGSSEPTVYCPDRSDALRYDFPEAVILENDAAARIVFDGTLAAIAGAYFRCQPLYDFTAMWWTTRFGAKVFSAAAQEYHFDMDRLHFLKFFIYLTDVTQESGPHVFVSGSHVSKPRHLCEPTRFPDHVVESAYPPQAIRKICGKRGSIFAVDTRGLHKGMPILDGHRLALQVEFAISLFGQNYPLASVPRGRLHTLGLDKVDTRVFRNVA